MLDHVGSTIRVRPSGRALGADIEGADLANLTDADFAVLRQAWLDHLVIRLRGVDIDDPTHVALSRRFGELDFNPGTRLTGKVYVEGIPEIVKISNIVENGKPVGELGAGEADWHTDMCFVDTPPSASLLRSLEIPAAGGDTSYLNMEAAYAALPEALKARVAGRSIKHDAVYVSSGKQRPGTVAPASGDIRDIAGAVHPIVRTHPETGRPSLYLGKRSNAYVLGLEVADSERLLDALWAHVLGGDFIWTQQWRLGDMLIWDNRCTMHRREAFESTERRLLHRCVVKGQKPV
ncbi:TauD/TfdA dioxygenase family protein [Humitalea sp. 24SJ18S-53]|uniref:TauD/TfdA dioxygenase family protein n=1 Tax=Humitalea sp. 24SJ18S-53 TaxID=3422307 RepID=UPI003D670150